MTAEQVHNFVRGLSPYPAAWANLTIHGQRFENVKIFKVGISEYRNTEISKNELVIPCKEGAVRILELQVPGKKRMDIKSFLNGLHG
jgi:methionyl-tRNA formyltransferase